jgi:hypothetical protein
MRKLKKERSPVRAYLNDPEDEKRSSKFVITELGESILEPDQPLPSIVQISTMFDKGTL